VSFALAQKVADAVLYEGYVLYPYRASSSKNQVRFQFGVVAPREYCEGEGRGSESWEMQTECLVEPEPNADPKIDLKVRCLQLQARSLEEATAATGAGPTDPDTFRSVEFMDSGAGDGELLVAWDEGVEGELEIEDLSLLDLARDGERRIDFTLPEGTDVEEIRSAGTGEIHGRLTRRRWPIAAVVLLSAEKLESHTGSKEIFRLRVRIENRTPWPADLPPGRDEALRRSLLSAHTLLAVRDGGFVSLLDPPPEAATAVAGCANLRTWPVLVGAEGSRDLVLSSPIILYDYPAIAPESQGDLCDATEIDEILTLRIMTLTDEEKREARGTDPRARQIVDRADGIPDEIFERLHGAMRSLRSVADVPAPSAPLSGPGEPAEPAHAELLSSWEDFLNPPGETPPEDASLLIGEVLVARGTRVILRPTRRADSMDFFLAGKEARVEGVYSDVENESYIAVTLAGDPTADLGAATGRFFYFYPDEIEPLSDLAASAASAPEDVEPGRRALEERRN
jgi:hypothetical protein